MCHIGISYITVNASFGWFCINSTCIQASNACIYIKKNRVTKKVSTEITHDEQFDVFLIICRTNTEALVLFGHYCSMAEAIYRASHSNFYLGCSGIHCNDQHPILLFSISRDHTDTEDRMAELRETLNLWKNQKIEFIGKLQAKVSLVLPLHSQGSHIVL